MDHLVETEVDGRIGIFNPGTARVHVLNETATDAWLLSDGEHTAEQIVALLASAYGVDEEAIRVPVLRAVDLFHDEGLLRRQDDPG
jgi:hypothetical protein